MKKSNISKIAALRACLTRFPYSKDGAITIAKDYLDDGLKYEFEEVVNKRNHAAIMFTIYDENDEYRQFSAEIGAARNEFTFTAIGLEENVYRCPLQLVNSINNSSRINHKNAWIVPFGNEKIGYWEILVSYSSVIAAWNPDNNIIYLQRNARNYSNTTCHHLSDFKNHVNCSLKIKNKTAVFKWGYF